jgi:polyketide biosynthesis enoyl-CoA hydratase PksI
MSKVFAESLEEGIFLLNINDPDNKNRFNDELLFELIVVLKNLSLESTLKVVIVTGCPDVFSAGGSLEYLRKFAREEAQAKDLFVLPNEIFSFPVPVIGALQGHAIGGGLILALCCDILVAAESSRYGVNFTNMGFTPGMGTTSLLPILVGHHFASEMILTGKLYKGKELEERGLFNYVVPAEQVLEVALNIARRIAEKPRHVLEMVKGSLSLPRREILQEAMFREHLMHKICFSRSDTAAHIDATYLA